MSYVAYVILSLLVCYLWLDWHHKEKKLNSLNRQKDLRIEKLENIIQYHEHVFDEDLIKRAETAELDAAYYESRWKDCEEELMQIKRRYEMLEAMVQLEDKPRRAL